MKKILLYIALMFVSAAAYSQVKVVAPITTNAPADTYPTHYDSLGSGGYMTMATIDSRDDIPTQRRKAGMLVYVSAVDSVYQLQEDLVTWKGFKLGSPLNPIDTTSLSNRIDQKLDIDSLANSLVIDTTGEAGLLYDIKEGAGVNVQGGANTVVNQDVTVSVDTSGTIASKQWVLNHDYGKGDEYTLPTMSSSTKGGARLGANLSMSGDVLSADVGTSDLFSGAYADLTGKPTLFSGAYSDLTGKPTLFSGSYTDLTDKPTIPTNNNQLTNGAGYLTSLNEVDPEWTADKPNYYTKPQARYSFFNVYTSDRGSLENENMHNSPLKGQGTFGIDADTLTGVSIYYANAYTSNIPFDGQLMTLRSYNNGAQILFGEEEDQLTFRGSSNSSEDHKFYDADSASWFRIASRQWTDDNYPANANFNELTSDSTIKISGNPKVLGTGNIRINPNYLIGPQPVDSITLLSIDDDNPTLYTTYSGTKIESLISAAGGGSVTSVGLSMPSAFSVSGSPITGAGTLNVTGAGTTNQYIRGNGTLATFPTIPTNNTQITNGENYVKINDASSSTTATYSSDKINSLISSAGGGSVTSVGLSMPSAFQVNGSPITSSGTLNVTGAGTINQYIRGNGTLATFPTIPTVNNNTITFTAGTGLTGGGTITLNQSTNKTITFNATAAGTPTFQQVATEGNTYSGSISLGNSTAPTHTLDVTGDLSVKYLTGSADTSILSIGQDGSGDPEVKIGYMNSGAASGYKEKSLTLNSSGMSYLSAGGPVFNVNGFGVLTASYYTNTTGQVLTTNQLGEVQLVDGGLQRVTHVNNTTDSSIYVENGGNKIALYKSGDAYFSGHITAVGGGGTGSDIRLKDTLSIEPIHVAKKLHTIMFRWKDESIDSAMHIGYIAQEVQKYMPQAVRTMPNGYLSVDYQQVHTAAINDLIQIVKKQQAEIDELKMEVQKLKSN